MVLVLWGTQLVLVICSGMLRSGSSLQFNLVSALLENMGLGIRHGEGYDSDEEWFAHPELETWAQDPNQYHVVKRVIRHHELEKVKDGWVRICYIYRDIRDVAASAKERWGLRDGWDRHFRQLDDAVRVYDTMHEMPRVLRQRYEVVIKDYRGAIREIARFLGIEASEDVIERVVEQCSLEAMIPISNSKSLIVRHHVLNALGRAAQRMKRFLPPPLNSSWRLRKFYLKLFPKRDPKTKIGPGHISSTLGAIGTWRQKLEKDEQEIITARYKSWLIRAGYINNQL